MRKTTDRADSRGKRQLKIGDVILENNVILAPMAGVTDLPFRVICKEQGAGLLCMEMVSAKAVHFQNKNTDEGEGIGDFQRGKGITVEM